MPRLLWHGTCQAGAAARGRPSHGRLLLVSTASVPSCSPRHPEPLELRHDLTHVHTNMCALLNDLLEAIATLPFPSRSVRTWNSRRGPLVGELVTPKYGGIPVPP